MRVATAAAVHTHAMMPAATVTTFKNSGTQQTCKVTTHQLEAVGHRIARHTETLPTSTETQTATDGIKLSKRCLE